MDAMTQMVLAGEGGLMAAMVAIENDASLAASLATASVAATGTPIVQTGGAEIRQEEGTSMDISSGEARQGEPSEDQVVLPPQPSKRPFESPLYRRGYRMDRVSDISMQLGSTQRIVVQVNDQTLHAWARSLTRKPDGHIYVVAPSRARWFQGVNTGIAVDTVQQYMRDCASFPRLTQKPIPLSTPRFRSVMDYVATMRVAPSSPAEVEVGVEV
ncbi:MAG: hypothetical protein ACKPKO_62560, partial [Candidatus Fonsibacter sp.]